MSRFTHNSLAEIEFVLRWQDHNDEHEEYYCARRVNAWRDIFPQAVREGLEGAVQGDVLTTTLSPLQTVPPHDPKRLAVVPTKSFQKKTIAHRLVTPRIGRFYPMGMLSSLSDVYPQTVTPFRLIAMDDNTMTVDRNHPLAPYALSLESRVVHVEEKQSDTGGVVHHWLEEICNWGPGMQASLPGIPTQFVDEQFFTRSDENADSQFYREPRMIGHVDAQASANLLRAYSTYLQPGLRVLDLMASMESHLPQGMDLEVVGLGLNASEMQHNSRLGRSFVHDLNQDPMVPEALGMFDVSVCSLSIEYLTNPLSVLRSLHEHLNPGGWALIGFSNRWFPTKAVEGWLDLHDFERMGFVRQLLHLAGFKTAGKTMSFRNYSRTFGDPHFFETKGVSDPVFVVAAQK
ncbi:hypothetical protein [Desulfovibrio inopinatus]|uniref:hypothetical protein n=1 Tax=Desulfovibrio inopinatus TaxID=102109 RepID=UPI0004104806|nr:hypothetical protein [Desulfovibrio inopinatus]